MILGIDATNWIHTLWHARAEHALKTFLARVEGLVRLLQPSHVVACFDRRSFRHDLFPDYKCKRPDKDVSLRLLLSEAETEVTTHATIAAEDGFEADDCLATLAAAGFLLDQKVVLASPDKDLRQCLASGYVTILRGFRLEAGQVVEPDYMTAGGLHEQYGLHPVQWTSYQALCGDSGDGIPGCPGWGEKTTKAALAGGKTLRDLLVNPWNVSVTPRLRTALTQFDWRLMLDLVTLRTDVPAVWDAMR